MEIRLPPLEISPGSTNLRHRTFLPALSLWRRGPPGRRISTRHHHHALNMGGLLFTTACCSHIIHIYASLQHTSKHMFPDNTTIIDPVGPPYTPPETPADPERCKLLGTTGLVVQALSKRNRLLAFLRFSHNTYTGAGCISGHSGHCFLGH